MYTKGWRAPLQQFNPFDPLPTEKKKNEKSLVKTKMQGPDKAIRVWGWVNGEVEGRSAQWETSQGAERLVDG